MFIIASLTGGITGFVLRENNNISFTKFVLGNIYAFPLLNPVKTPTYSQGESFDSVTITTKTTGDVITINYHLTDFIIKPITIDGEDYSQIHLEGESNMLSKGMPDLPNICRSIIIPDTAKMDVTMTSFHYELYKGISVAPSKGNLSRNVNPDDIPYEFDDIYNEDTWFPEKLTELDQPYILRDFRGQVIRIYPFQYNPVKKQLRFYTDITIEIYSIGSDTVNCIMRDEAPTMIDSDFIQIYERHFLNFNGSRYTPVGEEGNMLIITYDDFWDTMIPFVEWKNMKGIPTEMVNVSEIGNADEIKTYITDYYNRNGLTFVLLVGDAAQVPTLIVNSRASDPSYSYVVGDDHYPDLFVGRFSAETIPDLETQVERTIEYEKYSEPLLLNYRTDSTGWYHKAVGIASNQGPGDDGEYDYEHIRNIRTDLLGYNFTEVDEMYDGSQGGEDTPGNPTSGMVSNVVNDGRSIINYCGHGNGISWGTSGFSNTDVNELTNDNMLPFIISVACLNGNFLLDDSPCFAETWLRATHNGEPTGAIATFMSSKLQSWYPPMDAQDEIVDILVESYPDNKKFTFGGLVFHGCMHMNDEYGEDGYKETDAWHLFGDPSQKINPPIGGEHNIGIYALDIPNYILPDETMYANATIVNDGLNNETDIFVNLTVDGIQVNSTIIPFIESLSSEQVSFTLVLPKLGLYEVTVNVTLPGVEEEHYEDNEKSQTVIVGVCNIDTKECFNCIQEALDDPDTMDGHTIIVPHGIYYENVMISKRISLTGENSDTTIINGSESGDVVFISADRVTISGFNIQNCGNNVLERVDAGIEIQSDNNTITENIITNNKCGIFLNGASNNIITRNIIINNTEVGIEVTEDFTLSNDNTIYHNDFISNAQHASDGCNNIWNMSYPVGGNFWDDYNGSDNDGDGIGDTPYHVPGGSNMDYYPFMAPWSGWNVRPYFPRDPDPAHQATEVEVNAVLSWSGGDPNIGDQVYYDIYFGADPNPPYVETIGPYPSDQKELSWNPGTLDCNTHYHWKIVAYDDYDWFSPGPVWEFTTELPELEIGNITGGWKFLNGGVASTEIKNVGKGDTHNVEWSISVKGGTLRLINVSSNGTIATLEAGDVETVQTSDSIYGLGKVTITVITSVDGGEEITKTVEGFILFFYLVYGPII